MVVRVGVFVVGMVEEMKERVMVEYVVEMEGKRVAKWVAKARPMAALLLVVLCWEQGRRKKRNEEKEGKKGGWLYRREIYYIIWLFILNETCVSSNENGLRPGQKNWTRRLKAAFMRGKREICFLTERTKSQI